LKLDPLNLPPNYRIDDLQRGGFVLCQKTDEFCFGIDSVILSDFASKYLKRNAVVMDLCTGNGIIPVLLAMRLPDLTLYGIEIQENEANLASFNAELNSLTNIFIKCGDIRKMDSSANGTFDAVTVNPPYIKLGSGAMSPNPAIAVARHEVVLNLNDVCYGALKLLRDKGSLFMVHRTHRLSEIMKQLSEYRLSVKRLRFVYSNPGEISNLVLIHAMKNAGIQTDVDPPLYIFDGHGAYSSEIDEIYGRKNK
jgi:tRNA1(Val) A37 N6-methylase TrmN6